MSNVQINVGVKLLYTVHCNIQSRGIGIVGDNLTRRRKDPGFYPGDQGRG